MHTQVTDENGAFRFDMLPGGNLTLKISLEGYSAENTAVRLDRDQERLLTVRKLRGYAIGHSNDVYYTSQAPAFSEEWIYYCDGSSLRRVGRDGKKDRQVYDMGEGVEAGWLNLDGDWLYYIGALEINGTMHTSVERIHVKDGSHEVLWNSPEGTLYEKAFGLMVRDGYVFYALEKDRNEDEWVEIRCLVPGTEPPVVLARFDRLQQEGASGSYVGFNCDETGVYVHVNGGKDKHSWILRYDYTELNGELKTDTYDLQTQKNYEHTLYSGAGSLTPRQVVLFAEGFLLLGHESEVYLYEELAEGLKAHDRIRWDVSTANGSETVDKTFLAARHCVLEDTLIMPVGSGVYVSQNGKDAFREKLTLEHGFNLHNDWIGQGGQAVYMIYNYAGDEQTESKILLTVFADGSFTETVITK
jgi:hypothetical protein